MRLRIRALVRNRWALATLLASFMACGKSDNNPGDPKGFGVFSGNDGNNQTAKAGTVLPSDLLVVVDFQQSGLAGVPGLNPAGGIPITFTVVSGGGALSVTTATTDSNGVAGTKLTLGPSPGSNVVQASFVDGTWGTRTFTFTETGN